MTDKQIKDEIDISKCEFCSENMYCHIYSGTADFRWMCEENEDCQIKNLLLQLKRKEQECEELKIQNKRLNELTLYWHKRFFEVGRNELKLKQTLAEIKEITESTSSFKSIFEEPFAEVMKHCPYLNDNVFCAENKTSCVGWICARKQAVYYGEKVAYLEQILRKISECEVNNG